MEVLKIKGYKTQEMNVESWQQNQTFKVDQCFHEKSGWEKNFYAGKIQLERLVTQKKLKDKEIQND